MYIGSLEVQSNQATWQNAVSLYDGTVGPDEYIDITGCTVTMTVRDAQGCIRLSGSDSSGEITFPEPGTFIWDFSESQMNGLCAGTYDVGVRIANNDKTVQLIIGSVAIVDGVDRQ